jgi:thiol-disulfide isomerase/thioredoxin
MTAVLLIAFSATYAAEPAPVTIKTVKYADLGKAVRAHKGKVVVVDIWASWCLPCKKEFPELVELHRKYGDKGLVCISVSVDEPGKEKAALEFLQRVKANFANYRLEEGIKFGLKKWDVESIPTVFVFDRDNRRAGKFTGEGDKEPNYKKNVVPLVIKLLGKEK